MHIIAGLGNPGRKYENTRHNSGFAALDILSDRYGIDVNSGRFHALCGKGMIEGEQVLLLKPQTFMNLSGTAVREAVAFFKADPEQDLIVLYDDVSLPAGHIRIRPNGSAGGHNGMQDIIDQLGTDRFKRVRIGVGHEPDGYALADWVLGHFPLGEQADMIDAFDRAARAAAALLTEPIDRVMNKYNTARTKPEEE